MGPRVAHALLPVPTPFGGIQRCPRSLALLFSLRSASGHHFAPPPASGGECSRCRAVLDAVPRLKAGSLGFLPPARRPSPALSDRPHFPYIVCAFACACATQFGSRLESLQCW
eukprot:12394382-Alexandrium_andersonii.AAC.1